MVDIVVGRNIDELEKLGTKVTAFLGKEYIKMEQVLSLANRVFLDINYPHIILICGKRGTGKSYTLAVIAEELASLPDDVKDNMSVLIFDTMGIFWTMKYPNYRDAILLEEWGLEPKAIKNVRILSPPKNIDELRDMGVPVDGIFALKPSDLTQQDWAYTFNLPPTHPVSILIGKAIRRLRETSEDFNLEDIERKISEIGVGNSKEVAISLIENAMDWGIFSEKSPSIDEIVRPGTVNILDTSLLTAAIGGWSVKNLIIGIIAKKIFYFRLLYRKKEEVEDAESGYSVYRSREKPIVWMMIDEAHEVIPREGVTPASEPMIQIIREGRQPGISLVLATQQPGKIHTDVMTQTDIVISHRLTSKLDIQALSTIMENYLAEDLSVYMNYHLPKRKGSALILDDKAERIFPAQIRPRFSWHGGQDPSLVRGII